MTEPVVDAGAAPVPAMVESAPAPAPAPVVESAPVAPVTESPAPAAVEAPVVAETPSATLLMDDVAAPSASDTAAPSTPEAPKPEGEAKPGEQAATESQPAPEETPAPVPYEFTFPEGFDSANINQERFESFKGVLGEGKVSKEAAQKLLDMHVEELSSAVKALEQNWRGQWNRQQEAWKDEIRADPEIGGSRLQTAMRSAGSVIEQFGGSAEEQAALRSMLVNTGAGNNPLLVKLFHRVGDRLTREGAPVASPPPRPRAMSASERGLNRYKGSNTPGAV
jgi:hypothetical protein